MHLLPRLAFALVSAIPAVVCDFLGPTYPAPSDLTSDQSLVKAAWEDASALFDAYLKQGKNRTATADLKGIEAVTFSAGLFSLEDSATTELQYHYTAPQIANASQGTNQVDADSIYRVASVTKLITVLTGILDMSEEDWNRPITELIPEFKNGPTNAQSPEWDKITPWALAGHLAGIQTMGVTGDLLVQFATAATSNMSATDLETAAGLPPRNPRSLGPCALVECTPEEFVASFTAPAPVLLPYTTPSYSDLGMMILGLAISRITGKPYDKMYEDAVFAPLSMASSFANAPTSGPLLSRSVIAGPLIGNLVFPKNNPTIPSGGILTTVNDLNKLGLALLNSTLLSPDQTRRWMKPHSHTASLSYSIGAPWEIYRFVHDGTGKVTDIYTKLGDSGAYGGMLAVIPEYNAGWSFLNAFYEPATKPNPIRGTVALGIINTIAVAVVPALEAQAAAEATSKYTGTYTSSSADMNSSLVIAFNESTVPHPRTSLSIQSWISNGTDMVTKWLGGVKPQLLVSIPKQTPPGVAGEVTFQLSTLSQRDSYQAAGKGPFTGFYDTNPSFAFFDGERYDGGGLDTFTFDVDEEGFAKAVTNSAARLRMEKGR